MKSIITWDTIALITASCDQKDNFAILSQISSKKRFQEFGLCVAEMLVYLSRMKLLILNTFLIKLRIKTLLIATKPTKETGH